MREVVIDRTVSAPPEAVLDAITPERIVEWEGSFAVAETESLPDGDTLLTLTGPGVGFRLRFSPRKDGYHYAVPDEEVAGPFDHLVTRLVVEPADGESRVELRSTVSLNLPLPFTDRVAAWKRRGELRRTLAGLADAV